jgi:hypothetical protein
MMTSKQTTYNIQHLPFLLFDINITEELLNLLGHQGSSSYYFVEFVLLNLSFRCRSLFFLGGGGQFYCLLPLWYQQLSMEASLSCIRYLLLSLYRYICWGIINSEGVIRPVANASPLTWFIRCIFFYMYCNYYY